jgi:hypothetical protein
MEEVTATTSVQAPATPRAAAAIVSVMLAVVLGFTTSICTITFSPGGGRHRG